MCGVKLPPPTHPHHPTAVPINSEKNPILSPPLAPYWAWFPQPQPSPFASPRLSPPLPDCLFPVPLGSCPSQGAKIIQSFLWYLNPRQVFDLSQGGPKEA